MEFIKKYQTDFLFIVLLFLSLPLFFYKLGQSSLISFDEAWYGDIARNILKTGDFINLSFNNSSYTDHPPAGFLLVAFSLKILGENEFAVRFPAASLGFLSLIVIYFLGKQLFGSKVVGFASALALSSSFWFLFRARSGNLDVPLTFFFLLTLLLALKSVKNNKFLLPWSISLIFLFLTKTLVPFIIIPSLLIIFWKRVPWKYFFLSAVLFMGWFLVNIIKTPGFINHYFSIGLPGVTTQTNYLDNLKLIKEYLHSGIGKWFWPGILAIFFSLILRQKRFLILSAFFITFFVPFIFSQKGHIWHLIPLYPVMILSFFGFLFVILNKFTNQKILINIFLILLSLSVSLFQIKIAWNQFIDIPAFISDEAILSLEAKKYPEELFIDGDFVQAAVYYSNKKVKQIHVDGLPSLFGQKEALLLITKQERLDNAKIPSQAYTTIKSDRDKILILKKALLE